MLLVNSTSGTPFTPRAQSSPAWGVQYRRCWKFRCRLSRLRRRSRRENSLRNRVFRQHRTARQRQQSSCFLQEKIDVRKWFIADVLPANHPGAVHQKTAVQRNVFEVVERPVRSENLQGLVRNERERKCAPIFAFLQGVFQ